LDPIIQIELVIEDPSAALQELLQRREYVAPLLQ